VSSQETTASEAAAPPPAEVVARVADQLTALDSLADRPLAEHADVYQQLHAGLQAALGEVDSA
jgi:hypothetical protein